MEYLPMRIHQLFLPLTFAALLACAPGAPPEPEPAAEPAGEPVFKEGFETGTTEAWDADSEAAERNELLPEAEMEPPGEPYPGEPYPEEPRPGEPPPGER
jgi:hypothetical protein